MGANTAVLTQITINDGPKVSDERHIVYVFLAKGADDDQPEINLQLDEAAAPQDKLVESRDKVVDISPTWGLPIDEGGFEELTKWLKGHGVSEEVVTAAMRIVSGFSLAFTPIDAPNP